MAVGSTHGMVRQTRRVGSSSRRSLQCLQGQPVQEDPPLWWDGFEHRLSGQLVTKRQPLTFADEDATSQAFVRCLGSRGQQSGQQPRVNTRSDDGRCLEHTLGWGRQTSDTPENGLADRTRHTGTGAVKYFADENGLPAVWR